MEETEIGEVGVDKVHETAHEVAHEEGGRAPWLRWLALSTACFAVFAAIASLVAGSFANEALIHMTEATLAQAQEADTWSEYQAKGIKGVVREAEADLLAASHGPSADVERLRAETARYHHEQEGLRRDAEEHAGERRTLQRRSATELGHHERFAHVVTLFQVVIGLSAVAALVERRAVWYGALAAGAIGTVFFVLGLLRLRG